VTVTILHGDCRELLKTLPDESVHCAVTSPPFWGLRDYGIAGQLGMERSLGEYIDTIVGVFSQVRRVLRSDGTLWLNLGDSYAGGGHSGGGSFESERNWRKGGIPGRNLRKGQIPGEGGQQNGARNRDGLGRVTGLKPKDLCGIPWRVAFALQADGWYLRQDIIWAKPNPMPESVTDRCTKAHEYIFLLSKSARYYYDSEAIKEPAAESVVDRAAYKNGGKKIDVSRNDSDIGQRKSFSDYIDGRNKRSVWTVTTQPFSDAHFATFPPALIEPCVMAGTSEKGCCAKCGAPMEREIFVERPTTRTEWQKKLAFSVAQGRNTTQKNTGFNSTTFGVPANEMPERKTIAWRASCQCAAESKPCVVLDPFGGAGTTGMVADRLGRDAILIELNPEYATMADKRLRADAGMFAEVTNGLEQKLSTAPAQLEMALSQGADYAIARPPM
jgi:DNA modification methylase